MAERKIQAARAHRQARERIQASLGKDGWCLVEYSRRRPGVDPRDLFRALGVFDDREGAETAREEQGSGAENDSQVMFRTFFPCRVEGIYRYGEKQHAMIEKTCGTGGQVYYSARFYRDPGKRDQAIQKAAEAAEEADEGGSVKVCFPAGEITLSRGAAQDAAQGGPPPAPPPTGTD